MTFPFWWKRLKFAIYVCGNELEHIVSSLGTDAQKLSLSGFFIIT